MIFSLQVKAQAPFAKPILYNLENKTLNPIVANKDYFKGASYYDLQVFNSSIGLFDNFTFINENQYEKSNKMNLIYSRWQPINGNITSLISPFFPNRADSFNPSGSSDFKSVLSIGLINLLLNKNNF